jgi:hypothetical protein
MGDARNRLNNKHTMKKELLFVGLDVHARNIAMLLPKEAVARPAPTAAFQMI